jgi:hypothetical protein
MMMMLAVTPLFLLCTWSLLRARIRLWPLTLRTAWYWCIPALVAHVMASTASFVPSLMSARSETLMHFVAAALLLTPAVSVLGARRPGASAWPWFVTLPMLLVLLWPAVNEAMQTDAARPIQPGTPAVIGILTVLVMTGGNYFGTRNTAAAAGYATAVLCHLAAATGFVDSSATAAFAAVVALTVAACLSWWNFSTALPEDAASGQSRQQRVNTMWFHFRDLFGIVWAKRVADRVNQFAARESWSVILTLDGLTMRDDETSQSSVVGSRESSGSLPPLCDQALDRPQQVLCWVLRRFATPPWFELELGPWYQGVPESVAPRSAD